MIKWTFRTVLLLFCCCCLVVDGWRLLRNVAKMVWRDMKAYCWDTPRGWWI